MNKRLLDRNLILNFNFKETVGQQAEACIFYTTVFFWGKLQYLKMASDH